MKWHVHEMIMSTGVVSIKDACGRSELRFARSCCETDSASQCPFNISSHCGEIMGSGDISNGFCKLLALLLSATQPKRASTQSTCSRAQKSRSSLSSDIRILAVFHFLGDTAPHLAILTLTEKSCLLALPPSINVFAEQSDTAAIDGRQQANLA